MKWLGGQSGELRLLLGIWALAGLLAGCGQRIEPPGESVVEDRLPAIAAPVVERGWARIRRSGVLRVITFYNSRNYFLHRGGQAGFDFELVERFARSHDLTVEVVVAEPGQDLISLLNAGRGDVVCNGMPAVPGDEKYVLHTRPTGYSRKVVLLNDGGPPAAELADLAGLSLTIPWGCPFLPAIQELRDTSGVPFRINQGPSEVEAEELMTLVAEDRLQAVVVDNLTAQAGMASIEGLQEGPALGEASPTVWMVRRNNPQLLTLIDEFLAGHLWRDDTGRVRRSQTYGIIFDRYFENPSTIQGFREAAHRPDISGRISGYDSLVRRQSEALGLDWRLVSALIYQESRFYPRARSVADARGLMQVLPEFAGPQADSLYHPAANLRAGLRLLATTHNSFAYLDSLDRWLFTLATYHAGIGHVTDARRLAMDMGRDPNHWEDGLAVTLPLLMQHRHYRNTRHGYYRGSETVDYVEEILNRFRNYCRFVERDPEPPEVGAVR